jgi:hypothetical protein
VLVMERVEGVRVGEAERMGLTKEDRDDVRFFYSAVFFWVFANGFGCRLPRGSLNCV